MKTPLLKHPEIIDPFALGNKSPTDYTFVKDLGLETFLGSLSCFIETRTLAHSVMVVLDSDDATTRYRQDALEELIKSPRLRENVRDVVTGLNQIDVALKNFGQHHLERGLAVLRVYRDFIQNFSDLKDAQSEAVLSVHNYLRDIRASREFSEVCDFIDKIENLRGIDFRVTLDKDGTPLNMSALELVEKEEKSKKPFFERIFGSRRSDEIKETNLRRSWGDELNALGKIIQEYIDEKFIEVIEKYVPQIEEVRALLVPLDFYRCVADYFIQLQESGFEISRPHLLPQKERKMRVINARNPLLMKAKNQGHEVVPNNIEYDSENNIFVITGPNNGGKTTYVKTVGLIQLMAQKGLFVPARYAEVSFVDGIYTHFVAPDDITKGEGRYRNELRRMKDLFKRATPYSLVILDEPCGGTSYEEGQRQSLVLLDGFHKLGSATYFTTHMHPITTEVNNGRYPAAQNLQVECQDGGEKIECTYRVIAGSSGKSYGEEIASEIGLKSSNIMEIILEKAEREGYRLALRC